VRSTAARKSLRPLVAACRELVERLQHLEKTGFAVDLGGVKVWKRFSRHPVDSRWSDDIIPPPLNGPNGSNKGVYGDEP
jgi:hypothetical protein